MIAIPDVREVPLSGGEDFVILACDGLWDFLSENDAARMVYQMVRENPGRCEEMLILQKLFLMISNSLYCWLQHSKGSKSRHLWVVFQ